MAAIVFRASELQLAHVTLGTLADTAADVDGFARAGVALLPRLVACELATFSACRLDSGHREVISSQRLAIGKSEIEVFDRHFFEHPLVQAHGTRRSARTERIDDLVARPLFRRSALFNEYYRPLGIEHVMAMPLHVDERLLVSFVFNRRGRGFDEHERGLLDLLRPQLAAWYRCMRQAGEPAKGDGAGLRDRLTAREAEVLTWVAAGKANRDIAAILGASVRTIEKHLEHAYEKLGVETRTAAAMRFAPRPRCKSNLES